MRDKDPLLAPTSMFLFLLFILDDEAAVTTVRGDCNKPVD
jgi:hypothetical protein